MHTAGWRGQPAVLEGKSMKKMPLSLVLRFRLWRIVIRLKVTRA